MESAWNSWNFQELPKMLASLKLPKIPLESDMALFFNFPGSMGSSRYFWELPEMLTSWELHKIPFGILTSHYFQLAWINEKFPKLPGTSQNPGKLGTTPNSFRFWHGIIYNVPGSMGSSRNFRKLPWELPKLPSDLDMASFFSYPGSMGSSRKFRKLLLEFPKLQASWELPKIPSDFDMAIFFNFPGSMGSFQNFGELPCELPKIPSDFDKALFFNFPEWI